MNFKCYTNFAQLPMGADELFYQSAKNSMFFTHQWFDNLIVNLDGNGQDVLLACVVSGDNVLTILPLLKDNSESVSPLNHRYTSLYSILLADHDQEQILKCLVEGVQQLSVRALQLEPIDENDNKINSLQGSLESYGFKCQRHFRFYNWIHRLQGQTFEEYMAARPAKLRNTIKRKKRKLEREQGYEIRLFNGDEVPQAMADYHTIYKASWKAYEQFSNLLDGLVSRFSKSGWSRLAVLYIKGQPAAAQLWFVVHGKANIFRLAYDERWKQYSPGSLLTAYLMEYVIDTDGVEEIDFLTGNEAYKQDWMSIRRERWALSCVKSTEPSSKFGQIITSLKNTLNRKN